MIHGSLAPIHNQAAILRRRDGQSILEYFLLFAAIMVLTVIGISVFFPRVQASFNAIQDAAIEGIVNADIQN